MWRCLVIACLLLGACAPQPPAPDSVADFAAPPAAQARFAQALALMDEQQWQQAATAMERLHTDYPFLSGPALNAALIHIREGDHARAQMWFQRSLEARPDNIAAHNQYAVLLRAQGQYLLAEEHYLAALAVDPDNASTHYNLGILYDLYLGRKRQALTHFTRYQQLSGTEDRQVAGWVADLQRQLDSGGAS